MKKSIYQMNKEADNLTSKLTRAIITVALIYFACTLGGLYL